MTKEIIETTREKMSKSVEALSRELAKLRSGRAHPSLLEHLLVSSYGTDRPLNQIASITISDPRTLTVSPWDKNMVGAIEKAIMTSELGLNPATSGTVIRVPLPPLTEQRRKEMVKIVRNEGENARVAVRNIRRDANNHFKEKHKTKEISEDELRRAEDNIQKMTDKYIAEIDKQITNKEAELMEV